ncbi:MAG TPA: hypothetical protein VIU86_19800 [Gaiellaceae bacterium]
MSTESRPAPAPARAGVEAIAGLLAAVAIFVGVIAIFYRPARIAPAAILLALLATGMSRRWSRLGSVALGVAGLGWLLGMTLAVVTNHALW